MAKDVAKSLGYRNTRDAIAKHVRKEDKLVLGDIPRSRAARPLGMYQPETVLIKEQGL